MKQITLSTNLTYKNNFDFLRFLLAFSVVMAHFSVLSGNKHFWFISSPMAVAGFFIISGFLITWSYLNNSNLKIYIKKRISRIAPAYYFVVIICAGFLFFASAVSFREYFFSKQFLKYLIANLSFLNFIEPKLPGVFEHNIFQAVNGSLWSIKVEIVLYACVPLFCFLLKRINKGLLCIGIYLIAIIFTEYFSYMTNKTDNQLYASLGRQFIPQLRFFISGAAILLFFDTFQKYVKIIFFPALLIVCTKYIPLPGDFLNTCFECLFPIAYASILIGVAFNFKYLNNFGKYGDYSYGIYLFHFPIIQLLVNYNVHERSVLGAFFLTIILTGALAFFSWNIIEKTALKKVRTK